MIIVYFEPPHFFSYHVHLFYNARQLAFVVDEFVLMLHTLKPICVDVAASFTFRHHHQFFTLCPTMSAAAGTYSDGGRLMEVHRVRCFDALFCDNCMVREANVAIRWVKDPMTVSCPQFIRTADGKFIPVPPVVPPLTPHTVATPKFQGAPPAGSLATGDRPFESTGRCIIKMQASFDASDKVGSNAKRYKKAQASSMIDVGTQASFDAQQLACDGIHTEVGPSSIEVDDGKDDSRTQTPSDCGEATILEGEEEEAADDDALVDPDAGAGGERATFSSLASLSNNSSVPQPPNSPPTTWLRNQQMMI